VYPLYRSLLAWGAALLIVNQASVHAEPPAAAKPPAEARRAEFAATYGAAAADAILAGVVRIDMTMEQVLLARGAPVRKEVIPPDAELWHYAAGEVAFSGGKVTYVGLAPKPLKAQEPAPKPKPAVVDGDRSAAGVFATVNRGFAQYASPAVSITAPDIAENGAVVPVTAEVDGSARRAWLFVDTNSDPLVCEIDFSPGAKAFLSTRARMSTGDLLVVFERADGTMEAARKRVQVTLPGRLDTQVASAPVMKPGAVKFRGVQGTAKTLITSPQTTNGYVQTIVFRVDGQAFATVRGTPWMSKDPYFSTVSMTSGTLSIEVIGNDGSRVSAQ